MEEAKPEGVGGNELGCNTAPVATSNNSDFGSVCGIIERVQEVVVLWQRFLVLWNLGFQGRSHEKKRKRRMEGNAEEVWEQWKSEEEERVNIRRERKG